VVRAQRGQASKGRIEALRIGEMSTALRVTRDQQEPALSGAADKSPAKRYGGDARTTRHRGYDASQSRRPMIEYIFGWGKLHGTMQTPRHPSCRRHLHAQPHRLKSRPYAKTPASLRLNNTRQIMTLQTPTEPQAKRLPARHQTVTGQSATIRIQVLQQTARTTLTR
jgi:hypothetical protein